MKVLHLTLKKFWFDMIDLEDKREEYRDIKPYWITRLIDIECPEEEKGDNKVIPENIQFDIQNGHDPKDVLKAYFSKIRQFDAVIFRRGYSGGAKLMTFKLNEIIFGEGRESWGAEPGKKYFVIKLGERIDSGLAVSKTETKN